VLNGRKKIVKPSGWRCIINTLKKILLLSFVSLFIASCGTAPYRPPANIKLAKQRVDLNNTKQVKNILYKQYTSWRNTSHRMGGLTKKGIDCSGLVYRTYRTKLGINVPRTTELQSQAGRHIKQKQLRPGDLVFFKTGLFSRHVGLYMGKRKFLHVSSKNGVSISSLDDYYWSRSYWKSTRVK
jgi:probable lipoprotein NlpC